MGCWNGTCGISQLPIRCGDKVKTFLMLQSEYATQIGGAGVCYSTAHFRPWFFAVDAEYNDYGSIENIKPDWNSKYMLKTFQKWLKEGKVKILDDDAEINSPDITEFKTLDDVFDCVERGALVCNLKTTRFDYEKKEHIPVTVELRVGMFLVLEPVFTTLLSQADLYYAIPAHKYYRDSNDEKYTNARDAIIKYRKGNLTDKNMADLNEMIFGMAVDNLLGGLIEEHCAFKHYKTLLQKPKSIDIDVFFAKVKETEAIGLAMSYLRKLWIPQAGQGSQSEDLNFNKALVAGMQLHFESRQIEEALAQKEHEEWERKYKAAQSKKKA